VFNEYLCGLSITQIAERLNADGVATYYKSKWSASGIQRILENEKYKGEPIHPNLPTNREANSV
jgi:hypothetical protein